MWQPRGNIFDKMVALTCIMWAGLSGRPVSDYNIVPADSLDLRLEALFLIASPRQCKARETMVDMTYLHGNI